MTLTARHRLALAAVVLAIPVAVPAVTPAAKVELRLSAAPDASAPEGRTPKVVFTLLGTAKGRRYRIEAKQVSGQSPLSEDGYPVVCASVLGRLFYDLAPGGRVVFDPSPLTSYELGTGSPCTGTYKGKVLTPRGSSVPRVLQTFTLQVPSMRLTHVRVPKG